MHKTADILRTPFPNEIMETAFFIFISLRVHLQKLTSVHVIAWRWSGDKLLPKPCWPGSLKHTRVTRAPTWWRHQMDTFSALLALCAGNSPVIGEFPAQRPVTRGFDVFFDVHLNKRLNKQSWGWWFQTPSLSLWRHRNVCAELSVDHITAWPIKQMHPPW